jgi:hypothetical protein
MMESLVDITDRILFTFGLDTLHQANMYLNAREFRFIL